VVDDRLMNVTHIIRGQEHLNNTPGQQALWQALFPDTPLPKYAHMSVTVSDTGGKLSKRERPKALRTAIKHALSTAEGTKQDPAIARGQAPPAKAGVDLDGLAEAGGIAREQLDSFINGDTTPDMPIVGAMAQYLGVALPEINIVDFFKSGYLPEAMVNFLALLGWNPGDNREIMVLDELRSYAPGKSQQLVRPPEASGLQHRTRPDGSRRDAPEAFQELPRRGRITCGFGG